MSGLSITDLSSETAHFASNYIEGFSETLSVNIIDLFGGEESFIENYKEALDHGISGLSGFKKAHSIMAFYDVNKADIIDTLDELTEMSGLGDHNELLTNRDVIAAIYTQNELANIIDNPLMTNDEHIIHGIVQYLGVVFSEGYAQFLND